KSIVEMDKILNVGGFSLDRALEVDPKFMEAEYPFVWGGVFSLAAGLHELVIPDRTKSAIQVALVPASSPDEVGRKAAAAAGVVAFSGNERTVPPGGSLSPCSDLFKLELPPGDVRFVLPIEKPGPYATLSGSNLGKIGVAVQSNGTSIPAPASRGFHHSH